jgi:hypothetical protein
MMRMIEGLCLWLTPTPGPSLELGYHMWSLIRPVGHLLPLEETGEGLKSLAFSRAFSREKVAEGRMRDHMQLSSSLEGGVGGGCQLRIDDHA